MINSAQWKGQIATICLDRWQRIFCVNKTLSIITVKRRASPCANYSSALARRCASHENGNTYVLCSQPGHLRQIGMSQPSACSRLIVPLGKRVHRWNTITLFFFFYCLWGSSLSSLTLISAALVRRWSDEASAWMNNAETPANKRRHPLTPFHGASPYARVPHAFKLPPSAPVWKKKEKREREKQMTAESNINKPEAARKSKRRMRGGGWRLRGESQAEKRGICLSPHRCSALLINIEDKERVK